jgi:hypothetical protein
VDSTGDVGLWSSIAIAVDGNPVVSYYDVTNGDLRFARCNDPACAGANETLRTLDSNGNFGWYTSLAVGLDGNAVIAYSDQTGTQVRIARAVLGTP